MGQSKYLSLKQIQDMLPKGKKLKLIYNALGPCDKNRTVVSVKSNGINLENEAGEPTYMFRDTSTKFELTDGGFKVSRNKSLLTEYKFID